MRFTVRANSLHFSSAQRDETRPPCYTLSLQKGPSMTNATSVVSPIFDGFTAEEYESTLALLEQRSYAKGDVILHEGKSEQALWILLKGTCEVVKKNKGPTEHTLATLEAGSGFGEMSFFPKPPPSAPVSDSQA